MRGPTPAHQHPPYSSPLRHIPALTVIVKGLPDMFDCENWIYPSYLRPNHREEVRGSRETRGQDSWKLGRRGNRKIRANQIVFARVPIAVRRTIGHETSTESVRGQIGTGDRVSVLIGRIDDDSVRVTRSHGVVGGVHPAEGDAAG